jgi:hypothetical protein
MDAGEAFFFLFLFLFLKKNPLSIHMYTNTHKKNAHNNTEPGHDAASAGYDVQPRHDGPGTVHLRGMGRLIDEIWGRAM